VSGVDKWALWSNSTQLRGANIYQRRVYTELDGPTIMGSDPVGPPYTQEDFDQLAALGANYVNISHPGLFTETTPFTLDLGIQNHLDGLLDMIAQADMFAVISFRTGPGRSEFTFFWDEVGTWFDESYLNDSMWQDQTAQDAWVDMWRYTAERYRDNPIVVGYDLMVEPNSNEVGSHALYDALDIWDPDAFYATHGGTLYDWNQLYPRIVAAIREVDGNTPILIGGNGYSSIDWLPYLQVTGDPRTVYLAHQYQPVKYTHQWWDTSVCTYPGLCDLDWDGEHDDQLDRAWLESLLSPVDTFSTTYNVPMGINEFGVMRWEPGAAEFIHDEMELFEERGLNHALWLWDPAWAPWAENDAFNFRHGPDPSNHSDVASSDVITAIVEYWGRNTQRPSSSLAFTPVATVNLPVVLNAGVTSLAPVPLDEVTTWAYQIQDISLEGALDALEASSYDMLVLEPTRTDWSSDDKSFDAPGMVTQLKNSPAGDGARRKLLIAYIDIGEAEDWRWYWTWSKDWDCVGDPPSEWPDYILTCDPDGWSGNYPVAYWDPDWKDIIIYGENTGSLPGRDYNSLIDEVIKDGFDGIYLDWVEGYENEAVVAAAQAVGKDPAIEMITFMKEMRLYAASRNPDFIIIQQNAAALIDGHPELLNVIDAISQEAVWYDGDATDDWDDPSGHDWPNDASLTSHYVGYLDEYLSAGVPVFNCEYALALADTAYANSYREGYVPYTSRRSLSRLTTTPPPGYRLSTRPGLNEN
jgi:cysteinyl-tRNA synthetase